MILRYELDRDTRVLRNGRKLVGGGPVRVMRLGKRGSEVLGEALSPEGAERNEQEQALLDRLADRGLIHPRPVPVQSAGRKVSVVIPAFQESEAIGRLVKSLDYAGEVIVVDDGSTDGTGARAAEAGARVLTNPRPLGPAAARNLGFRAAASDYIVFLDADCEAPPADWLDRLLPYLIDGRTHLVAPRVTGFASAPEGAPGLIETYEVENCPLDMGGHTSLAGEGCRVGYLPSAAMLIEKRALEEAGGFDESLRYGEDVDLVWRLGQLGKTCRFDPSVRIRHRSRDSLRGFLSQQFRYARSAVDLEAKHPGRLAPARGSARSIASACAMPWLGPIPMLASAAFTARKLRRADVPLEFREAFAVALGGELSVAGSVFRALSREWLLPCLLFALLTKRGRRLLWILAGTMALSDAAGCRGRSSLKVVLPGLASRLAYSTGLWSGSVRARSFGAILPRIHGPEKASRT